VSRVYLSALTYVHGDCHSITELGSQPITELASPEHGLACYRSSDLEIWQLAVLACSRTIEISQAPPDLMIYVTENELEASRSMARMMRELGLTSTHYLRVSGHGCGNLGPALLLARQALASGAHQRILLVLADRVLDDDRSQVHSLSVLSDGAASCLVTSEPTRSAGAQFAAHEVVTVTEFESALPDPSGEGALAMVAMSVAGAAAITRQTGQEVTDYDHLVFPNYRIITQQFLCSAMGVPRERLLIGPAAEFGHCFSADILVTLARCASTGQIKTGDHILACANGLSSCTTLFAECLCLFIQTCRTLTRVRVRVHVRNFTI
jgi:3-oxoacyl-[acyl-carrier-protein] synthase-3